MRTRAERCLHQLSYQAVLLLNKRFTCVLSIFCRSLWTRKDYFEIPGLSYMRAFDRDSWSGNRIVADREANVTLVKYKSLQFVVLSLRVECSDWKRRIKAGSGGQGSTGWYKVLIWLRWRPIKSALDFDFAARPSDLKRDWLEKGSPSLSFFWTKTRFKKLNLFVKRTIVIYTVARDNREILKSFRRRMVSRRMDTSVTRNPIYYSKIAHACTDFALFYQFRYASTTLSSSKPHVRNIESKSDGCVLTRDRSI